MFVQLMWVYMYTCKVNSVDVTCKCSWGKQILLTVDDVLHVAVMLYIATCTV